MLAAIALGSNVGDRAAHLNYAVLRLRDLLDDLCVSDFHQTVPVDTPGPQPLFLNAAAVGRASLNPRELLDALMTIEQERWRKRLQVNAPRTLDLDLVLFGDAIVDEPGFVLPHPRFRGRRFVLEPLAEIAPAMRDPVTGLTVAELLKRLEAERDQERL